MPEESKEAPKKPIAPVNMDRDTAYRTLGMDKNSAYNRRQVQL